MATTAVPFIRPLSLAELLDQAVALYKRNFLVFIGIIAIPYIPIGLLGALSSYFVTTESNNYLFGISPEGSLPDASYWLSLLGTLVVGFLYLILVQGVATAALTRAIADNYTGRPVSIFGAYRSLGSSWLRLLFALLAALIINIALFIWFIVPCIGWITGLGALFFSYAIVGPFIAPVVLLEKQGWFSAYRRAWDIARSRFWWLVGFGLIVYLFSAVVVQLPTYLIQMGVGLLLGDQLDPQRQLLLSTVLQTVVSVLGSLLYLPLSLTAFTVVYFDTRVRSEGLDLALQAAGEFNDRVNIISLAETSPPPQGPVITGTDIGYFLLLTLIGVALYALLVSFLAGVMLLLTSIYQF